MGLKEARPLIGNPAAAIIRSFQPPPSVPFTSMASETLDPHVDPQHLRGRRKARYVEPTSIVGLQFVPCYYSPPTGPMSITTGSTSAPCQGLGGSTHLPISHVDSISDQGIEEDRSSGGLYSVSRPTPDLSRSLRLRTPTGRSHSITLPRNPALRPLDCQQSTGGGGRKFPSSHHWVRRDNHQTRPLERHGVTVGLEE